MALGVVGCGGGSESAKPAATTSSPAATTAAPTPSVEPALDLVDDQESADAGKAIEVKVLGNDSVTLKDGTKRNVEVTLAAGEFTVAVDSPPVHGAAKVDGATIVYTSSPGYGGDDEFTYRVDVAGQQLTGTAVVRITVAEPTPTPTPKPTKPKVSYANCDAVRAAGAAPLNAGDPGYGPHLDRDGDGVGCETSSGGGSGSTGGGSGSGGGGSTGGGGGGSTYYANCAAVRAAGAAPIHAGEPGYGRHLDRDGDGVGCE
ncbi:excalibur calcium-binding domain-containing protein [Streptomyces sp. CA-135486]|uniref:excalibur calcium-binding domain-containing protein n=1 Tax=Streptomyces sp. CA-135486 TaxID=3240049 RepID=UPI003D9225B8